MKKLCAVFVGAGFMLSLSVNAATAIALQSFDCESDSKITVNTSRLKASVPEYTVSVRDANEGFVKFTANKNFIFKNQIKTQALVNEKAHMEEMNNYLTVQGRIWALAIAPEKKRASLYSSNPDINEVPMFCLSRGSN